MFYAERHYSTRGDDCGGTCYNRTGKIWQFLIFSIELFYFALNIHII